MRSWLVVGAAVGALVVAASAVAAETPLVFELGKRVATFCYYCRDERIGASGQVDAAPGRVRVQTNECQYPGWNDVASADPGADGRWETDFYPPRSHARVRIVWNGRASAPVELRIRSDVSLRFLITPRRRQWYVAVSGGAANQRTATLERFANGEWRAFRTLRLGRYASGYRDVYFRLKLPPGQPIRARYNPRHRCWDEGISPVAVTRR